MNLGETMQCRRVRRSLSYHLLNKLLSSEKCAYHVAFILSFPPMYPNKIQEKGVKYVANINKIKFELYGDLVEQAFLQFNENLINNQDLHSQIEKDETVGAEYPSKNDSEEGETNIIFAIPNFIPQVLPDDEIAEGITSLN